MPMLMGSEMALKINRKKENNSIFGLPVCLILHLSSPLPPSFLPSLQLVLLSSSASTSPLATATAIRPVAEEEEEEAEVILRYHHIEEEEQQQQHNNDD